MKRYFLETSVIVSFLRGRNETIREVENLEGELTSSFICLAELYEGIFRIKEKGEAKEAVLNFFNGLSEIYTLDREVAENFGQIRAELKLKGEIIEDLDILLAATCLAHNLILVTYNPKHFKRIKNLQVLSLAS